MARSKVTITLDRVLDRMIKMERLRQDLEAYRRQPPTESEKRLGSLPQAIGIADDTDWESLYPVGGD
ncbi:MAG: hypothetical protein ACYDGR_04810 [Candidatus Dormibacteria bacterium]